MPKSILYMQAIRTNTQKNYTAKNIFFFCGEKKNTKQFYTFNRKPYFMLLNIKE